MSWDYPEYPTEDPGSGAPQPTNFAGGRTDRGTVTINNERVPLANWIFRAISGFVDYGIPWLLMQLIISIGGGGSSGELQYDPNTGTYSQSGGGFLGEVFGVGGWLLFLAIVIANSVFLQGLTGQSLGKRLVGTQLIWTAKDREGDEHIWLPGIGVAAIRAVLQLLNAVPFMIGYIAPLFSHYYQSFTDMSVKTYVLRRPTSDLMFRR